MTNFEQKYKEFRDAFKEAVLNNEFEYKVEKSDVPGYNGMITFFFKDEKFKISVADTFVCYLSLDRLLDGLFNRDDIRFLNKIVKEYFLKDKEKFDRIEKLKKELYELESEVA